MNTITIRSLVTILALASGFACRNAGLNSGRERQPEAMTGGGQVARASPAGTDVTELRERWKNRSVTPDFEQFQQLEREVTNRLVELETARLGIVFDEVALEKRHVEAVEEVEKFIEKKQPGMTLDEYAKNVLGVEPLKCRETIREDARRGWFAERCVRAFVLQGEQADVRPVEAKTGSSPLGGRWSELASEVERSLAGNPIDDPEFKQWQTATLERYGFVP